MGAKFNPKLFVLVVLGLLFVGLLWQLPHWVRDQPRGGEFRLQGADGPVHLKDFRGQWLVLYFGYTRCPDVCPTNLAIWANVFHQLSPAEKKRVSLLFVSLDDLHDSAENVHAYARYFDPEFIGATADKTTLAKMAENYGVKYRRVSVESAMGDVIDHSSYSYWVGPKGQIRRMFLHAPDPEMLLDVMRQSWQKTP